MMQTKVMNEQEWMSRAGQALRESEQQIDAVSLMRLRGARARAVAALSAPTGFTPWRWALPCALAAGLVAWMLLPRTVLVPELPPVNIAGADALDLLTDELGPEFYQNLDLYLWLEDEGQDRESDKA